MCGIFGAIYSEQYGSANQPHILQCADKARAQLHHRGPDEHGTYIDNHVLLGHTRLSIIDLASGKQPLSDKSGKLHLVANGEIYNYLEVAAQFSQESKNALTHSDCEAIFQAYQAQGIDGLKEVFGMFAFALYDEETSRTILCRDRLGIKPLFFSQNSRGVFFASEIKALLPFLDKQPAINPVALTQFLQHQFNTGRETIFEGIQRVLPGEYLVIEDGHIHFQHYWDAAAVAPTQPSFDNALEQFDTLFDDVITQHMRADVPFGLFLSGGIDSSILLARLKERYQHPLKTYSIGFSGTHMQDELDAANQLAAHFGTEHQALRVSRDDLFGRIVHSIWAADDLMRDYAALPTHALSEVAAKDVKIVFSGEGGDEAFAGYRRYRPTIARNFLYSVLRTPGRVNNQWHRAASRMAFSPSLSATDTKAPFIDAWQNANSRWSNMAKRQYVDIKTALSDNLFVKTDRMMMAFGLEGRVPFSDHRIIEFGLSLPDEIKYKNARGKWLLREWAKRHLPHDHLSKPKRGFYVPVTEWLSGKFLDALAEKLLTNHAIKHWFNVAGVKKIISQHKNGKNYSREIWGLMQFAIWHTLFVEQPERIPNTQENPLDWL